MKGYVFAVVALSSAVCLLPASLWAQNEAPAPAQEQTPAQPQAAVEEETNYSYGVVKSISANQIAIGEYDYDKDEEVTATYSFDAAKVELENVAAATEIAVGDYVDIEYAVKDGANMAMLISVEKQTKEDVTATTDEPATE